MYDRAVHRPATVEESTLQSMEYAKLHRAISELPEIQKRRLILYYFQGLTYEQIAGIEGCTKRAVKFSVDIAVEKLTKKLEGLESQQATMKAVNAYCRKHKTLDGCPELTPEQAEKLKADMAQSWHLDKSKPYPAYLLSNNNANIRRVRQRIEELSSRSEFAGWTFPGGEAKINEAENRLQLIFEEKPDADQRQELKSNGFKWAPSQGAWQRQLNQNAIRAAARIDFLRPEDGTSPYQLQPFVKRENKEMSR